MEPRSTKVGVSWPKVMIYSDGQLNATLGSLFRLAVTQISTTETSSTKLTYREA